ncbi:hypothetical protein [Selenomonas sputigena]|uniref:hypothetical protein n=1 Tax=Selenomonas sputigena TaxID=69823 RepID=UPI00222F1385|nr:hypothetical protein [Selenomonas sputigena]UZD43633.1 hypothetical protein OL240_01600 [Selenomonas sputigena]
MCSGGGGGSGSYTPPKVDPAPTTVQPSDLSSKDTSSGQKRRRGRASTSLANDRDTILGTIAGSGGRTTLG